MWWLMPVISVLGGLRQENCHEFKANMGYLVRPLSYGNDSVSLRNRDHNILDQVKQYLITIIGNY